MNEGGGGDPPAGRWALDPINMLQVPLRNDSTERLLQECVDGLDDMERRVDTTSWEKAAFYLERYDHLAGEEEFIGKSGNGLTYAINKRLRVAADERNKLLPSVSFLSDARKLGDIWPEVFRVDTKILPYDYYRVIAVCSLSRPMW
jgi:hypothetical protein